MGRYFRHLHPFYGIKAGDLRQLIRKVQEEHCSEWTASSLMDTAETLLGEEYGEKKMLGVYLLGVPYNLKKIQQVPTIIDIFGGYIEEYVNDWATCDNLSSQVVRHVLTAKPEHIPKVQAWSTSSNDWKQRASCVSFLSHARHGTHNEIILDIATRVIQNRNRFPQLGVGWMLRDLTLADEDAVVEFIKEHYTEFTREGLRYAIEKMNKSLRQDLLNYGKADSSKRR
jgi:3-methyladenine DNA glycosylase AlkD